MTRETVSSIIHGPTDVQLLHKTIGEVIHEQVQQYGDKTAVIVPWQNVRLSFRDLERSSAVTAKALIAAGVKNGDMVAVMAGNRWEYIDFFLAAARIGCPLVVLNNTYTPKELISAVSRTSAKIVLIAENISRRSLVDHIQSVEKAAVTGILPALRRLVILSSHPGISDIGLRKSYKNFLECSNIIKANELRSAERLVRNEDVVNVQFTSGTTGLPKAALLTHKNILNNGRFVGTRMHLSSCDVMCCPPPLFHCFGIVMGFLNSFSHGASIVLPSDAFDASRTLDAIVAEGCTALLGVPTMFIAQLEKLAQRQNEIKTLRVGLASGAPVPLALQERLWREMGIKDVLIAYGMTEVSPVSTMMDINDSPDRKKGGLGTAMPHNSIKIINKKGQIVPRGQRGEICSSGYALMKGYLDNPKATNEAMRQDENGVLWMHTGDEGLIDSEGYPQITGRIKDMIIRGGENIFPAEIEERILEHPAIAEVSVIGLPDNRYGEVVASFLRGVPDIGRPSNKDIQQWVGSKLGRHKVPVWIFDVGPGGALEEFPKTGSGKHQKHILRDLGRRLLQEAGRNGMQERARL